MRQRPTLPLPSPRSLRLPGDLSGVAVAKTEALCEDWPLRETLLFELVLLSLSPSRQDAAPTFSRTFFLAPALHCDCCAVARNSI